MRLWHQETSFFQQEMAEALNSTTHNPQWSNQIVEESLDEDSAKAMFEPINGTNLTSATISATTVDNPAYGIAAKQKVSILWLNMNSNVLTFLITSPMINGYTPDIVSMVEAIAGSSALGDVSTAFAGVVSDSVDRDGTLMIQAQQMTTIG